MLGIVFRRRKEDQCVCFKLTGDHLIYLVVYVDDMFMIRNNKEIIQDVKTPFSYKYYMKVLGSTNFILGMEIKRDWKRGNYG
jgi:hypothetical protein